MNFRNTAFFYLASAAALIGFASFFSAPLMAQSTSTKGQVVEEIVARVNNEIITLSDYQKADEALKQEVAQDCQACSDDKIQAAIKDQEKNLLSGLIDKALLLERAKDMSITVDADLVKELDDIRKQNKLDSMEDLQKAVESTGMAWEDYKAQMKDELMRQQVIRQEVAGHMDIAPEDIKQYYDAHKQEFEFPEEVVLAEIFLSTEGRTPEEIASVERKAQDLHDRVARGQDFVAIAEKYSEGQTAKDGGSIGTFKRGVLDKTLDDAVFKLNKGQITDVIQVKTGFEILKVVEHFEAGLQPLSAVQEQIQDKLYMQKMEPAMHDYLAQLREESYVTVKPGYTDTAAVPGATAIQEVAPTPDEQKKKGKKKLPSLPAQKTGGM
jgi:peptidyl-prolyl cis-trans isomerase SurA